MAKTTFNQRVLSATGVSLATLFIIIAGNAKSLFEGLAGLPVFITAMANNLPLGVGSYLLAQLLGPLFHLFLLRWLPAPKGNIHRKDFFAETLTLLGCSLLCLAQQWGGGSGPMLMAGALGAVAGFSSPWIVKGFQSIAGCSDDVV